MAQQNQLQVEHHVLKTGPWRSKLLPHKEIIFSSLREGKSYQFISDLLIREFGVKRTPSSIWNFVHVRIKGHWGPTYDMLPVGPTQKPLPLQDRNDKYTAIKTKIQESNKKQSSQNNYINPAMIIPRRESTN